MADALGQLILGEDTTSKEPVAKTPLSISGTRSSAAGNNPTGYGAIKHPDGSYTWDVYETPQAGVAATQQAADDKTSLIAFLGVDRSLAALVMF